MKLRSNQSGKHRSGSSGGRVLWIAVGFAALAVYTSMIFSAGMGYYKLIRPALRNLTGADTPASALAAVARSPANFLRAHLSAMPLERIEIDIKFKHLQRIHEKRDEALRLGALIRSEDD